ncbi:hypothetical protein CPC08DRAFT_770792 [Agrocybe pediades]|nr:hypothetical protein CPC08DRAFT_770792 [Agrocybe pediades]
MNARFGLIGLLSTSGSLIIVNTVQRGFSNDPDQLASSSGQRAEAAMLIASLRDVIRQQSTEIETLQKRLKEAESSTTKVADLQMQVESLQAELATSEEKRKDVEKEQEDLLVLLDEVTTKRKKDNARLREAGMEVSADEADDDEDEDEEEDAGMEVSADEADDDGDDAEE